MKNGMAFLATVLLAVVLAIPARGAEKSTPKTGMPIQKVPTPAHVPAPVNKPDLVISISSLGSVYDIGKDGDISKEGMNVAFTVTNKGRVATGGAGSTFSVGVEFTPSCQAPDCNAQNSGIGGFVTALNCQIVVSSATKSFHFSNPNLTIISPPLEAGETRTAMGVLVLPGCLQYSTLGPTASVYLTVDDKNQVDESNENNNKSGPISVSSKHHW
jgi:hypothetical protein